MKNSTTTLKAWHTNPQYMSEGDVSNPEKLIFSNADMSDCNWLQVGTAEVTLTVTMTRDELITAMVSKLNEDIDRINAEAHKKTVEIKRQINDLLALPAF